MSETVHCTHCGAAHTGSGWPKTCTGCTRVSYKNPIPVAVAVVPIIGSGRTGLLGIRRDIEPQKGELALPGGYVDYAETWQEACVREVREETGLELDAEMGCLEKSPADRPQTMSEVAEALRACAAELEQPWTEEDARQWWEDHQGPDASAGDSADPASRETQTRDPLVERPSDRWSGSRTGR